MDVVYLAFYCNLNGSILAWGASILTGCMICDGADSPMGSIFFFYSCEFIGIGHDQGIL